jgi:hypothetical protein
VGLAVNSEETGVEKSGAGVSGKVQAGTVGAKVKSWFCDEEETGAAGAGGDSGEAGAVQQHALLQWQRACATRPTQAAGACAEMMGTPASNRLQTMAHVVFTP